MSPALTSSDVPCNSSFQSKRVLVRGLFSVGSLLGKVPAGDIQLSTEPQNPALRNLKTGLRRLPPSGLVKLEAGNHESVSGLLKRLSIRFSHTLSCDKS